VTAEANKLAMSRFVDFINAASEKLATDLISPDAIFYVVPTVNQMRAYW
jgi:hypothetical protein